MNNGRKLAHDACEQILGGILAYAIGRIQTGLPVWKVCNDGNSMRKPRANSRVSLVYLQLQGNVANMETASFCF